tara:strand:+ start:421 stop:837 length:417 start_codon:yes stop_codon:yes gene_type:complete
MRISREKLSEVSKTFIDILDKEGVKTLRDLERLVGQAFPVSGKEQEYLVIIHRPSNLGTRAIDASYVIQHKPKQVGGGIPLDLKMNQMLNYSQIIIKTDSEIKGYGPFAKDSFDNIIQGRIIDTINWQEVQEEIKKLF